jgi:uncharacterized protein (TIGR02246 family)
MAAHHAPHIFVTISAPALAMNTLVAVSAGAATAATVPAPPLAEAELRAINHRFVNAFAMPDGEFIDALTAKDFLLISTSGDWVDRAQHVDRMRQPQAVGRISYDDVSVRLYGAVAVLRGLFEATSEDGKLTRVRYTDVYHWAGSRWQLVSAQNTLLRDGAAKQILTGHAPASAPWRGADPSDDANELTLRVLNANYVRAFRDADVSWYDAHLSDDYSVTNSDGSLHDRARALEEFAKPVFATSIRSFPVDNVRVRRFDKVALIHAENDYVLKDGRTGINRYTDIWHQQADGRWRCVAAHITTFKPVA